MLASKFFRKLCFIFITGEFLTGNSLRSTSQNQTARGKER